MKRHLRFAICDLRFGRGRSSDHPFSRAGFTLIEAVASVFLVSILLTAALTAASASAVTQYHASDRSRGRFLAQSLMSEILSQSYMDPGSSPTFGPETGETTTPPSRLNYNDVDDYNNWTESPPQNKDGTVIPNFTGWTRSVAVCWVSPTNLMTPAGSETNIKRVTVTVSHNGLPVATSVAIKAHN